MSPEWWIRILYSYLKPSFYSQGFFNFGKTILTAAYPKYMNDVLHTAVERNYYFSSVPRFVNIFLAIFVGLINDWLITKRIISPTNLRKSFTAICKIDKLRTMEILWIGWLWISFSFIDHLGVSDCCLLCWLRWDIGGHSFFNFDFGIWSQCSRFRYECIGLGPKLSGFPQFTRPHSNKWSCYPCTIHHRRLDYQCKLICIQFVFYYLALICDWNETLHRITRQIGAQYLDLPLAYIRQQQ